MTVFPSHGVPSMILFSRFSKLYATSIRAIRLCDFFYIPHGVVSNFSSASFSSRASPPFRADFLRHTRSRVRSELFEITSLTDGCSSIPITGTSQVVPSLSQQIKVLIYFVATAQVRSAASHVPIILSLISFRCPLYACVLDAASNDIRYFINYSFTLPHTPPFWVPAHFYAVYV